MATIEIQNNGGSTNYAKLIFDYSYTNGNSYITLNGIKLQYHENQWFPWYPGRTNSNNGKQTFIKINDYEIKGTIYVPATYYWRNSTSYLAAQGSGGGLTSDVQEVDIPLIDGKINIEINCYLYSLGENAANAQYFNNIIETVTITSQSPEPPPISNTKIVSSRIVKASDLVTLKQNILTMYNNRTLNVNNQQLSNSNNSYKLAVTNASFAAGNAIISNDLGALIKACLVINDIPNLLNNQNQEELIFKNGSTTELNQWVMNIMDKTGNDIEHGCRGACVGICYNSCSKENSSFSGNSNSQGAAWYSYSCSSCGFGCDANCATNCWNSAYNSTGTNCPGTCTAECTGCRFACTSCQARCTEGCLNHCRGCGGCANRCDGECSGNSCTATCGSSCDANCGGQCDVGCENSCINGCATDCNSGCYGTNTSST